MRTGHTHGRKRPERRAGSGADPPLVRKSQIADAKHTVICSGLLSTAQPYTQMKQCLSEWYVEAEELAKNESRNRNALFSNNRHYLWANIRPLSDFSAGDLLYLVY